MSVKINVVTLLTHPKRRASVQSRGRVKLRGCSEGTRDLVGLLPHQQCEQPRGLTSANICLRAASS